jgi:hypothetical protein
VSDLPFQRTLESKPKRFRWNYRSPQGTGRLQRASFCGKFAHLLLRRKSMFSQAPFQTLGFGLFFRS